MSDPKTVALDAIRNICDHLQERASTLFLGAGINAGIRNDEGRTCPLGGELSDRICKDLLATPGANIPLDEAVEIARYRLGNKAVNDYIYDVLNSFSPGVAHLALVQLPWDVIYTTNFDLLVEHAATSGLVTPSGSIRTVLTSTAALTSFTEPDILYYKLHGTIDLANSPDGRLILTKSDYRFYEEFKRPLFRRLRSDLTSRNFLFVGYSLSDHNFRAVLEDCREELGVATFPLSYAVQNDFSPIQETFWRDKYNIQLVKADAAEFLVMLKDTWIAENCQVAPFLQRKALQYINFDETTRFQKVGDSFYLFRANDCSGPSNASAFFRGAEPSWADIRDKIPPHRDAYDLLLNAVYPEIAEPSVEPSAILITGSAGTGKTALLRSFVYDIADAFAVPVFIHVPGTPLDARVLTPLISDGNPQRFIVLVDSAAEYMKQLGFFWEEIRAKKLPITLLLEERKNQWLVAKSSVATRLDPSEIELGTLSQYEIEQILDSLEKYGCLFKLTGVRRDEQVRHFTALAHEDLLVALRELTSDTKFDKIVRREFDAIPFEAAKRAYLHVCSVGQLDLAIRYETLIRVLGLRHNQLGPEILMPTEGVLVSGEESGGSRHNFGFRLRARHPVIASVIFAYAAPTDQQKFDVLNALLSNLDPGFAEDLRLLREITMNRTIANTFGQFAMRRALYDRIATILPGDGYVFQHRSILEKEMHDPEEAVRFARKAVKLNPHNAAFQNTLGLALEFAARDTAADELKRGALLSEAEKLFKDGIQRDRTDPYGYLGMVNIIKNQLKASRDKDEEDERSLAILALLEDAFEATRESAIIAAELAKAKERLGSVDAALEVLMKAVKKDPGNIRLKQLQVEFSVEKGRPEDALQFAIEGAKADPTSWRIQRSLARIRNTLNAPMESVRGHYEAAIRHNKGDIGLAVELGAYLFKKGAYDQSRQVFEQLRHLALSGQERNRQREEWLDPVSRTPMIFQGKVARLTGATGSIIAIPANFEAFFWRSAATESLRENDPVQFIVIFNAQGAVAMRIRKPK